MLSKRIKNANAGNFTTLDDDWWEKFEADQAKWDARPWWWKLPRRTRVYLIGMDGLLTARIRPRYVINRVVWRWQRMNRGWADCDMWSMDTYIAKVMSEMLSHMADYTHAYPGQGEFDTPEKWDAHLRDMSVRLGAINAHSTSENWSGDGEKEAYATTTAAFIEFAKNFGYYWD